MDMMAEIMLKVNETFNEKHLESLGRDSGFIKRKRKVEPKAFLENLLLLKLESAESSLEDFACEFNKQGCVISKQALHKKCNKTCLAFIQKVLKELLSHAFAEPAKLGAIPFVNNVQVIDSSEIRLHKTLKELFPQVRNQGAAVKLQSLMEVVNNRILSLDIRPSKEPDQGYKEHLHYVEAGNLLIGDLGYFCVESFHAVENKKGFFLSRYFKKTHTYHIATQEPIDLRDALSHSEEEVVELKVGLGVTQFPCRLIAMRLTDEAYQKRLENLKEKRRKDPRAKHTNDILDQWTIFVTNLPIEVEAEALLRLYSLRWQIELFFKMMKTFLKLREIKEANQQRAMISLFISLIAVVLLSFVVMSIVDKEISLYKASKVFVKHIRVFIEYIHDQKEKTFLWLKDLLGKFALKESRKNRPSTRVSLNWRLAYA